MKALFFLVVCLVSYPLFADILPDAVNPQLEACKGDAHEAYCVGKVLLDAIQKVPGGAQGGKPKCTCACAGTSNPKTCSLYYVDGTNSGLLASDLFPRDCVEALRYPPCRD